HRLDLCTIFAARWVLPITPAVGITDRNDNIYHPGGSHMRRILKYLICISFSAVIIYGMASTIPGAPTQNRSAARAGGRQRIDFTRQIEPIFARNCYQCHGAQKAMGQLRLDGKEFALKGGLSGAAIVPGDSKRSPLVKRILGEGDEARMPMGGAPLTPTQIAMIRQWIDQGADWPVDD